MNLFPNENAPLSKPQYGASIGQALSRFFKNYANFYGRASRSEYWWVFAVTIVVVIAIYVLFTVSILGISTSEASYAWAGSLFTLLIVGSMLISLAVFIPSLSLQVRRLHDGNFSGFLVLLHLAPYLGSFALLILMLMPPRPEGARYDRGAQFESYGVYGSQPIHRQQQPYGTNGYDQPIYAQPTYGQPQFPAYPGQPADPTANPQVTAEGEQAPSSSNPYLNGNEDGGGRKLRGTDES